jgi:type I restriction enzyme M protein
LIPGSRKQKQLSDAEIERIAAVYREFKRTGAPQEVPGFCKVATVDDVRGHKYALTPGRYVGSAIEDDEDEPFEERFPVLKTRLIDLMKKSATLQSDIAKKLAKIEVSDG